MQGHTKMLTGNPRYDMTCIAEVEGSKSQIKQQSSEHSPQFFVGKFVKPGVLFVLLPIFRDIFQLLLRFYWILTHALKLCPPPSRTLSVVGNILGAVHVEQEPGGVL